MINSHLPEALATIEAQLVAKNAAAGIAVENEVKQYMTDNDIVDTGWARASVTHDSDASGAIIGTNLYYFPFIELGTRYQEARHPLVSGLMNAKEELLGIYGA